MSISNFSSGLSFKTLALKFRHTNCFVSIARDRDTGRIYPDSTTGVPRIEYTPSTFDRANIMEGVIALAKICYVEGATEIHTGLPGVQPFICNPDFVDSATPSASPADDMNPEITDPRFKTWLKELQRVGNKPPGATFASAHQMGSNRMSVREKDGVVDPKGRVWGTEGLYVSDASIFPSASGVNPMITNMAISDWVSRGVSEELRSAENKGAKQGWNSIDSID
jgi:choline dehydrogenase-like flavoprotein